MLPDLSLEQQAALAQMQIDIARMSESQAKAHLINVSKLLMQKDNVIKTLSHWKANGCTEVSPPPRSC